jgi:hypothetical protein
MRPPISGRSDVLIAIPSHSHKSKVLPPLLTMLSWPCAMKRDDIISHHDLVHAEKATVQKGMNYDLGKG